MNIDRKKIKQLILSDIADMIATAISSGWPFHTGQFAFEFNPEESKIVNEIIIDVYWETVFRKAESK